MIFIRDLLHISNSTQLRSSVRSQHIKYDKIFDIFKKHKTIKLKQLLREPVRRGVQPKYSVEGDVLVIRTINITKDGYIDLSDRKFVSIEFYNKFKKKAGLRKGDILITSTGEGRGKIALYNLNEPAIADTHISIVRCKDEINKKYLTYFLLSSIGRLQLAYLEYAVKGTPEIYPQEIEKLKIIILNRNKQEEIIKKINEKEKIIKTLKKNIKEPKLIADEVFSRYFNLDLKRYEELAGRHVFKEDFASLSKSVQLRMSPKFHHPKFAFILDKLREYRTVKLRQLLKEPVRRGVQPEYDKNGEIPVIKTVNLRNGYIDLSEAEYVNEDFFKKKGKKAEVKYMDILLASTGTGSIGKVDIWESDEIAIASVDISIVRVNPDRVNPYYLAYYLRSLFGYSQVEASFTGMSNQIHIYPSDIERFEILLPDKTIQNQIVEEIKARIKEQRKIMRRIEELKQEIDMLIEEAILR